MSSPVPRFEAVSRRHFLAVGGLGALALLPGVACSHDDKAVFARSTSTTAATTGTGSDTGNGTAASTVPSSGAAPSATTAFGSTTTVVATRSDGPALPAKAKATVAFSFQGQGGDRVRNPYIAVWIEDTAGHVVRNLAIWYRQGDEQYLGHLTRWYDSESTWLNGNGADDTTAASGATRAAGQYQLSWDMKDAAGKLVAQGEYVVFIEAAREHGPYELVTGNVTLGTKAFTSALTDNGELSGAKVTYAV